MIAPVPGNGTVPSLLDAVGGGIIPSNPIDREHESAIGRDIHCSMKD
jgi:hypothetical protein